PGDDRVERGGGGREQQDATEETAGERARPQDEDAAMLPAQLPAIAERAAGRAERESNRVADVRGDRRVPEREQRRERDEGARADDRVDGAREQPHPGAPHPPPPRHVRSPQKPAPAVSR